MRTRINGQAVRITEQTEYPFRETVTFKVKLVRPQTFSLHLRIPEWCSGAAIAINGKAHSTRAVPGDFAVLRREFRDGDVIEFRLPMQLAAERWFGGSAAVIRRGPLAYSLQVAERRVESTQESKAVRRVLKGNNVQGFPAVEFFPQSEWRYGMDAALEVELGKIEVTESPMGENPFLAESSPVRLNAPLRGLPGWAADWKAVDPAVADLKLTPKNPTELPSGAEMQGAGEVEQMRMVPYGATPLRVTTLPAIG